MFQKQRNNIISNQILLTRSRRVGGIVSSCVDMNARVPRWRCKRMEESSVLVSVLASVAEFMYYWQNSASKDTTYRTIQVVSMRYRRGCHDFGAGRDHAIWLRELLIQWKASSTIVAAKLGNFRPRLLRWRLTLWASSKPMTRPTLVCCSRNMLRHILNSAQAPSDVTQGHERSTIVRLPAW